jgi:hypothetical protein
MPIVINRKTGTVSSDQKLSQSQNQQAWETILREYIKKHPEVLADK